MRKDFLYKTLKGLALPCAALLFSLSLAACSEKVATAPPKAVPVSVVKAKSGKVPISIEAVGNVRASASVAVRSQVAGSVIERNVEAGKDVQVGDVLYRIDPRPFDLAILQAQANLEREQAALRKAEEDMRRYQSLISRSAVSKEQYDQARTSAEVLRGTVAMQKALLEQAKLQREYTVITAPIAGRTGDILVDVGSIVKTADDNVTLLTINTVCPADVFFAVPESRIFEIMDRMRQGEAPVVAAPEGYNGPPIKGVLLSMNNSVDQATGTITLKARFANAEQKLWPGQFVRVHLLIDEKDDAVLIPAKALQEGAQGTYVYVLDPVENSVSVRPVKIQHLPDSELLVLSGLEPGETVVVEGQLNLRPGSLVQVRGSQPDATAPAASSPKASASGAAASGAPVGTPGAASGAAPSTSPVTSPGTLPSTSPGAKAAPDAKKVSLLNGAGGNDNFNEVDVIAAICVANELESIIEAASADIFPLGAAVAAMSSSSSSSSSYSSGGISRSSGSSMSSYSSSSSGSRSHSKSGSINAFSVGRTTSTTTRTGGGGRTSISGQSWVTGGSMQIGGGPRANGSSGAGASGAFPSLYMNTPGFQPGSVSGAMPGAPTGGSGVLQNYPAGSSFGSPAGSPIDSISGLQYDLPQGSVKP